MFSHRYLSLDLLAMILSIIISISLSAHSSLVCSGTGVASLSSSCSVCCAAAATTGTATGTGGLVLLRAGGFVLLRAGTAGFGTVSNAAANSAPTLSLSLSLCCSSYFFLFYGRCGRARCWDGLLGRAGY